MKEGDKVDMEASPLPFPYDDQMAEFEYGMVEAVMEETPDCFVVVFENLTAVALDPDFQLVVE